MKIGIDITPIMYGTGVSRYTRNLVETLLKIDDENQYLFFFSSLRQNLAAQNLSLTGNFKLKEFKFPPLFLETLWNRLHVVNIEKFIGKIDLYHSWDWLQAPTKAKKITTVHDLSFLHFPETFPKKTIQVQKRRLGWVKKECQAVLADSQATKKDLIELLNFDSEKITVIHLGVEGKFKVKDMDKVKQIKNKYKINNYILSVGTLEPRKNLKRVIEAFQSLKKDNLTLLLVGKTGWGDKIMAKKNIKLTGFVPDEDLPYLYAGAKCFVYPSLYEGFGLPVLEAMSSGCPVVTSNVASLAEIAAKAAILVNPRATGEISKAILEIITNKNLSDKYAGLGKKRSEKFTWVKTAQETLKVYEHVYRN